MLHPVDWLKGSLNAEKYCRVQLLIIQKGVDENGTSVSIRGGKLVSIIILGVFKKTQ